MVSLYWHPAITPAPARATSVPETVNALGVDASVKIYILATETDLTLLSLLLGNLSRTTIWWMLSERALTKHRKFKFLYINLDTAEFHNCCLFSVGFRGRNLILNTFRCCLYYISSGVSIYQDLTLATMFLGYEARKIISFIIVHSYFLNSDSAPSLPCHQILKLHK